MSMSAAPVRDALIVAGGRGTRLQPLTYATPKPLLPFCGEPFLAGVIRRLAATGIERVFLVVGADTAPFALLHRHADDAGVAIEVVPEPVPLDTAGGVRSVADGFETPILVLNGDILTDVDYAEVAAAHAAAGADATLVLTTVEDTSSYGVCVRDGTRIVAFVEKPAPGTLPGQNAINAGTYVLEPALLRRFPTGPLSFERDVFPEILAGGGHLEGVVWDGVWADLGTPARYLDGHRAALDGRLRWPSLEREAATGDGVRVAAGARIDPGAILRGPVLVLADTTVEAGAVVGPHTVVGQRSHLGPGAAVTDSVLFEGVRLGPGVRATRLLAGNDARVDEGATLGRGVVLGDGQHVTPGTAVDDGQRIPPARG